MVAAEETVGGALARGVATLAGSETGRLDAELLLASVLDPPAGREVTRRVEHTFECVCGHTCPNVRLSAGPER